MAEKPKSLKEIDFKPSGKVFPSPSDWRDQFIYHLLVDRFNSGKENIPPYNPETTPVGRDDSEGEKFQAGKI
ncbi:MAG: hypothetical protein OHK0032_18200 [Thermodesulfovibrionales bacterium]